MRYLFVILLFAMTCYGQEECDHVSDSKERFDNVRLLPPIKVRHWNGKQIEFTYEDKKGIYVGSAEVDASSAVEKDFAKKYEKGKWWLLYCIKDWHVYTITPVLPKQYEK